MAIERTLSIIKPDAVAKNVIGQIVARFEGAGLKVVAARLTQLSQADAEAVLKAARAVRIKEDAIIIRVAPDNLKLEVAKSAIASVTTQESSSDS